MQLQQQGGSQANKQKQSETWQLFRDENKKIYLKIDENEDYVTRSKLTIIVKTLSKYNDWSRVAAKQTKLISKLLTEGHKPE